MEKDKSDKWCKILFAFYFAWFKEKNLNNLLILKKKKKINSLDIDLRYKIKIDYTNINLKIQDIVIIEKDLNLKIQNNYNPGNHMI